MKNKPVQLGRMQEGYDEIRHADVPCKSIWGRQHCITCLCNLKRDETKRKLHETPEWVHETDRLCESTGSFIGNVFMQSVLKTKARWFEIERLETSK